MNTHKKISKILALIFQFWSNDFCKISLSSMKDLRRRSFDGNNVDVEIGFPSNLQSLPLWCPSLCINRNCAIVHKKIDQKVKLFLRKRFLFPLPPLLSSSCVLWVSVSVLVFPQCKHSGVVRGKDPKPHPEGSAKIYLDETECEIIFEDKYN